MVFPILTGTSAIGYLHNVSPVKESEKKNSYFDMKLQTRKRTYRAVCFDPDLHDQFTTKYESSSPVKIANCQVKVNLRSNLEEILINKRSKILEPHEQEIDFDMDMNQRDPEYHGEQLSLKEIKEVKSGSLCDVFGRITFQGEPQCLNIRGNEVKMQEAVITDDSATVRLVLWESDIHKIESGDIYCLKRAIVKDFNNNNYITLNKQTEIEKSEKHVQRMDENVTSTVNHSFISCPAEGVQSIHRYNQCKKCWKTLVKSNKKLVKCSNCGLSQLQAKCKREIQANAFFIADDQSKVSILLTDDIIQKLFEFYILQNNDNQHQDLDQLTDEDIMEVLLSVSNVYIAYNGNNIGQYVTSSHGQCSNAEPEDDDEDTLLASIQLDEQD